jgi:hypothetical protein
MTDDVEMPPNMRAVRDGVVKALREYSTDSDHDIYCAAHSEGQRCCIDPGHERFSRLVGAIVDELVDVLVATEG